MLVRIAVLLSLVAVTAIASGDQRTEAGDGLTLTILHDNDASSMLLNPGEGLEDYGGVTRFKRLVDIERARASSGPNDIAIVVSGGNNIEVGPNVEGSITKGAPFYEAIAMRAIGYDAAVLGDQDFGLGPDVLADLLCGLVAPGGGHEYAGCGVTGRIAIPFLAANLDFRAEPRLQEFVDTGGIAPSTVVTKNGHEIGVVGVITPALPVVSSPRDVTVMSNTSLAAQRAIDALHARGVDKIIVLAQLGSIDDEVALAGALSGVDVIVAGGVGRLMANPGDLLVPGDVRETGVRYPVYATGKDGARVPIVTTAGAYKYLGKLVVEFDDDGNVVWVDPGSGPIRVAAESVQGGVTADPILASTIDRPLRTFLSSLASEVIATSQVRLDGRTTVIRTQETNLGNLMADAALWQASALASEFGVAEADVAILNAGGMRLDRLRDAGPLSRLDTYEIAPFASFISVVEDVSPAELKLAMENALSQLPTPEGRFGQIAGFRVTYDPAGEALDFDASGMPLNDGGRVLSIQLDDGTTIVRDGAVVAGAPDVTVATIDFLARGGDQYPFDGPFTTLGVSYQQALEAYVVEALDGVIGEADYPEGGNGRLVAD